METSTLEILHKLVAFPSVCVSDRYTDIADFSLDRLRTAGATCYRLPDPTNTRAGIFASIGPNVPGGFLLSAHLDVVPVNYQDWTSDPFRLEERQGRFYGRGTCDMKGFAAAAIAAIERASQTDLKRPLKIALSYDEEIGCVGIGNMIGELGSTIGLPESVIVGEPTSMRVVTGHKGKSAYRVTFNGEAGHSSDAPKYVNALHLAADFIGVLRSTQAELVDHGKRDEAYGTAYSTVHAGILSGGQALNIVPDQAVLDFEIRFLPEERAEDIFQRIVDRTRKLTEAYRKPAEIICIDQVNAYPGLETRKDDAACKLALSIGGMGPASKVSFGTEAGFFQAAGVSTVVCGPGSINQAHKADEYLDASELAACDAMMSRLIERLNF